MTERKKIKLEGTPEIFSTDEQQSIEMWIEFFQRLQLEGNTAFWLEGADGFDISIIPFGYRLETDQEYEHRLNLIKNRDHNRIRYLKAQIKTNTKELEELQQKLENK